VGRVVHFEIHFADLDRAERFYAEVFGWRVDHWEGGPIDYGLITTGPDEQPGINRALTERRGRLDGHAVIANVNTIQSRILRRASALSA
jgi:predicted enzyme related to lactoylglutathione lyase